MGSGFDRNFCFVGCGSSFTLTLTDACKVYGFGNGSFGQLGRSPFEPGLTPKVGVLFFLFKRIYFVQINHRKYCRSISKTLSNWHVERIILFVFQMLEICTVLETMNLVK